MRFCEILPKLIYDKSRMWIGVYPDLHELKIGKQALQKSSIHC